MPKNEFLEINFLADKVHIHHWPLDTPKWSNEVISQVDRDVNKNKEKKQIVIRNKTITIGNYEFKKIKKVGVTIPLFKKQSTLVFEGYFKEAYGHIHVTTKADDYLQIFNKLMCWRTRYFPNSIES
ncbi:hypothetical protein YTPLAS73_03090 [Nitrosarchaeum sp.]|nr:hypothetical protein YTPLAS73_03090 [Nitrosarchaeum sp.]